MTDPTTLAQPTTLISPGMFFASWTTLKEEIENWAIAEHFSFSVPKKDCTQVNYRCHDKNCSWRVYASLSNTGEIKTKIVETKHTCAGAKQTPREVSNTQSWLRRTVPKHLFVTRNMEVREIVECMQMLYHIQVNHEAARLT